MMPFPLTRVRADGTVVSANAEAARLAGVPAEAMTGRSFWLEAVEADDRWKLTAALRQAAEGRRETVDVRLGLRGVRRVVELSCVPAPADAAAPIVVVAVDLTEEKRCEEERHLRDRYGAAEAALREAALSADAEEAFVREALGVLGQAAGADACAVLRAGAGGWTSGAAWSAAGGRIAWRFAGAAAERLAAASGAPESLHVRAPAGDPPGPPAERALLEGAGARELLGVPFQEEGERGLVLLAREGGDGSGRAWSAAERSSAAGLARLFETLRAWRLAASRYRRTVAAIDACLFTYTLEEEAREPGARRYLFLTHQIETLTGFTPDALIRPGGDPVPFLAEGIHDEDRAAVAEHEQRLRAGEESRVTFRLRRDDGTVRWLREHGVPERGADGRLVVDGLLADVTDQKAAEAALLEAKHQAESASRLKSAFVATMSHEIRTPLGALNGFADLLARELADAEEQSGTPLPGEVTEFLTAIRDNAQRLLALVNDLFDLSNLEVGAVNLRLASVPLHDVVQRSAARIHPQLAGRNVELRLDLAPEPPVVRADAQRLEQVIDGLLSNAAKFTEEGEIVVRTRPQGGDAVLLEIIDTGVGIADEYREQLFTPFLQEDRRLNRSYAGTGLGLALVKRLLDLMDGRIEVDSRKGEGSTFRVVLPAGGR